MSYMEMKERLQDMDKNIDKKVCVFCKKPILDEKEYVCTDCYENAKKETKDYGWANNDSSWLIGLALIAGIFSGNPEYEKYCKDEFEELQKNKKGD